MNTEANNYRGSADPSTEKSQDASSRVRILTNLTIIDALLDAAIVLWILHLFHLIP